MPLCGVEPWTDFPSTSNLIQSRFFSDSHILLPPGEPQSGTTMTSSREKHPLSSRYPMPISLVVSSSAT